MLTAKELLELAWKDFQDGVQLLTEGDASALSNTLKKNAPPIDPAVELHFRDLYGERVVNLTDPQSSPIDKKRAAELTLCMKMVGDTARQFVDQGLADRITVELFDEAARLVKESQNLGDTGGRFCT